MSDFKNSNGSSFTLEPFGMKSNVDLMANISQ